ncbi:MAG: hypothetical protein AAB624_02145 [Patescibacteria group bacterium]
MVNKRVSYNIMAIDLPSFEGLVEQYAAVTPPQKIVQPEAVPPIKLESFAHHRFRQAREAQVVRNVTGQLSEEIDYTHSCLVDSGLPFDETAKVYKPRMFFTGFSDGMGSFNTPPRLWNIGLWRSMGGVAVTKNGWLAGEQSGDRGYQAYRPVEVVTGKMKRPEVYSRPEYCSVDLETARNGLAILVARTKRIER